MIYFFVIFTMHLNILLKRAHSSIKIPSVDISRYLSGSLGWENDCKQVAETLKTYGLLIIKDPRVNQHQNDTFLDLMEQYFVKRSAQYRKG